LYEGFLFSLKHSPISFFPQLPPKGKENAEFSPPIFYATCPIDDCDPLQQTLIGAQRGIIREVEVGRSGIPESLSLVAARKEMMN
jgi:hypothetical protein